MVICARCPQHYRVVTNLHNGYEVVIEIINLHSTSKINVKLFEGLEEQKLTSSYVAEDETSGHVGLIY